MEDKSLLYLVQWLLSIWLVGWILLPLSSRAFPFLADRGLAAGRLLALVIACLIAFWGASLQLIPLSFSPLFIMGTLFFASVYIYSLYARKKPILLNVVQQRRNLLFSDAIFLLSFLFFLWLRLCQPEIRGQEKPMDSAIIGVLSRSIYLPAENPWFSGAPFTSYYYFGHFMAATLTRTFQTPLPYAYNLIQPAFCAFFISILWSLCATVTGSRWKGLGVTALVGFCGNYEPLRQWYLASQNGSPISPLNWWSTSRVIPHTINEYPFFTLALGDAHAHFFGLSLFALFLCTCVTNTPDTPYSRKALFLQAIVASAVLMTNAWDFPILVFTVLFLIWSQYKRIGFAKATCTTIVWLSIAALLALPFLRDFHSPTRGFAWEPRLPDTSFLLVWGHFILLALLLALKIKKIPGLRLTSLLCITCAGLITLALPYLLFIRGHFEGDLRHQDTVFKFGLQAWLLLGIALGTFTMQAIPRSRRTCVLFGCAVITILLPTLLAPVTVLMARSETVPDQQLSLNGARHLSPEEQDALTWLTTNARPGDTVIESVGRNPDGTWISAYSDYARASSLTGIPAFMGWPQHTIFWGAPPTEVEKRLNETNWIYLSHSQQHATQTSRPHPKLSDGNLSVGQHTKKDRKQDDQQRPTRYIFWGTLEQAIYGLPAESDAVFSNGTVAIFIQH